MTCVAIGKRSSFGGKAEDLNGFNRQFRAFILMLHNPMSTRRVSPETSFPSPVGRPRQKGLHFFAAELFVGQLGPKRGPVWP